MYLVENYPIVIVVGETGSGKTTQIPQYLDEYGWANDGKIIGCTQPRRVAASTIAARVAEEMGCELGEDVGYTVRFEDETDPEKTRIKFMTDGVLLREIALDPLLTKYSVIMVDEAHERSIYSDILLGMLKKIIKLRPELRIIISSATVDAKEFKDYFNVDKNWINTSIVDSVGMITIEGRQHPVDIFYLQKPVSNYLDAAYDTIYEIHMKEDPGDILVFLTGQEEIDELVKRINLLNIENDKMITLRAYPMYSGLSHRQQLEVFRRTPYNERKVVVSTNLSETSITISGIVYVVDSGFVKIRSYNPNTGMESLVVTPTSQSSANQRAGRAGRMGKGKCYRLYTEEDFYDKMPAKIVPEIQRSDLTTIILQLKSLGINNLMNFEFLSPPPSSTTIRALEMLYALGAIDENNLLTDPLGTRMSELPLDPYISKILLSSVDYGCTEEILTIASMVSVPNIFLHPKGSKKAADSAKRKFSVFEGDHITLLNVYNSYIANGMDSQWCHKNFINAKSMKKVVSIRKQLLGYLQKYKIKMSSSNDVESICKCLVSGYFANAARQQTDGTYRTIRGSHVVEIHPNSAVYKFRPDWVIFHEVVTTTKDYMREVTKIDPKWLLEIAPHYYEIKRHNIF